MLNMILEIRNGNKKFSFTDENSMKLTHRLHKLKCELTTKVWKTLIIIDLYIVHDLHATPSVHWTYNSLSYNGAAGTDVSHVH